MTAFVHISQNRHGSSAVHDSGLWIHSHKDLLAGIAFVAWIKEAALQTAQKPSQLSQKN